MAFGSGLRPGGGPSKEARATAARAPATWKSRISLYVGQPDQVRLPRNSRSSGEFEPSHELAGQLRDSQHRQVVGLEGPPRDFFFKGRADLWAYLERRIRHPAWNQGRRLDWADEIRGHGARHEREAGAPRREGVRVWRSRPSPAAPSSYGRCRGDGGDGDGVDGRRRSERPWRKALTPSFLPPRISFDAAIKDAPLFRNFADRPCRELGDLRADRPPVLPRAPGP